MLNQCKASYRKYVLLLQFNKEMLISGPNSALDPSNYAIISNNALKVLPSSTVIDTDNGKDIRIMIPSDYIHYLNPNNFISIGYVDRREIKCVKSYDNYIYNVCDELPLGNEVPEFNLLDGYGILQNEDFILYTHTGENEIGEIYPLDFYAIADGSINKPYEVLKINSTDLLFKFQPGTFASANDIYLGVHSSPQSTDIYGLPIKGDVFLKITTKTKPMLKTLSLSTIDNTIGNRAYLLLLFDDRIKDFYASDFAVQYNGLTYPIVYEGNSYLDRTTFEVWVDLETPLSYPLDPIVLFTNVPYNKIKTINYENTPIKPVPGITAYVFYANNLEWILSYNDNLSSNEISFNFDTPINYGTLITNSAFDGQFLPWNGSDIQIPAGAISFKALGNTSIMSLNFNPSFGSITINSDPYNARKFVSSDTTNTEPAILKSNGSKISIVFSATESCNAYPMSIDSFSYKGNKLLMSTTENFLCYGYEPNGVLVYKDYIIVPPLTSILDNPFNGGSLNSNYLIETDNSHNYRTYGDSLNLTTINGYVRITGVLLLGQDITLQNLNILGTLYIKIGNGNINLDAVTAQTIVYE